MHTYTHTRAPTAILISTATGFVVTERNCFAFTVELRMHRMLCAMGYK